MTIITKAAFDPISARLSPAFAKELDKAANPILLRMLGMNRTDRSAGIYASRKIAGLGIKSFRTLLITSKAREIEILLNSENLEGVIGLETRLLVAACVVEW